MKITDITVPVLEAVGDFFSNENNYLLGVFAVIVLIGVWAGIQVRDWRRALRLKKEGDVSLQAAQLEVQHADPCPPTGPVDQRGGAGGAAPAAVPPRAELACCSGRCSSSTKISFSQSPK